MRRVRFSPGPAIGASLLLLLLAIVVVYAWIDGGAERVNDIAQPVMPERAP
jgi:hypothetical protein